MGLGIKATLETSLTDPIEIGRGAGNVPSSAARLVLAVLKPQVTVETPVTDPIVFAPFGEPMPSTRVVLSAFLVVVLALAVYGASRLVR